ncbi:hypothetical protein BDW02DRAFT_548617 [Decorospora gaudefroyi]|uniref:DNA repair protein XRCC4 n=1 Tax=Decorospora gaudefroyi TaxID=184978 RepID=A0A6A5KLF8_9PLEO|nr:hypothetical protein BDW02DRAFT_548617 [Decorospora gaudefroyi]
MSARCIVPVAPASSRGETVVVEVHQEGGHPLDVRLVGCEGANAYVTTIKHRNLAKLKHKFKGSDDEWVIVLSHFLLQQPPEEEKAAILNGVRMIYTLKNNNLELSFRQDVQGIKVTLGEIVLPQDDEFELNAFEWAQTSALAHAHTLQELADLKARVRNEQDTIAKLNAQLDDFIKTKNEAETAMLQQFMELLNEKKRKIRDQSRILAGAKVGKTAAIAVHSTRPDRNTRRADASRTSKRKAPARAAGPDPAPDPDSDQMEIDQAKTEEQDEDEVPDPVTPDQSEDETEEEDEPAPQTRARSSETLRSSSTVAQASQSKATESKKVPPPRTLPFNKLADSRKGGEKKELAPAMDDEEDDETEEEL